MQFGHHSVLRPLMHPSRGLWSAVLPLLFDCRGHAEHSAPPSASLYHARAAVERTWLHVDGEAVLAARDVARARGWWHSSNVHNRARPWPSGCLVDAPHASTRELLT